MNRYIKNLLTSLLCILLIYSISIACRPTGPISKAVIGGGSGSALSLPLKTGQTISYATGDDGDLEQGLERSYTIKTTGNQSGTTNITINGKTHALSNNTVPDNRTGLEWARYVSTADIGPAADGRLFWKQYTITGETVTFNAAGKTITAAVGNPFSVDALCIGRVFTVADTVNNNGVYTVANIAGNVITTVEALVNEGPIATDFATVGDLIWDLLDQANANALGGYTDWRIPNRNELESILNIENCDPAIDTTIFPSTPSSYHWSASTHPCYSANAFSVGFGSGYVFYANKQTYKCYVRLCRG